MSIALKPDDEYVKSIGYEAEKIAPRLYSIASSADYHDGEVHLTVRVAYYQDENGETKPGLCSGYLASLAEGTEIEFTIKPNNQFRLPAHEANEDIILIGPGTSIAPLIISPIASMVVRQELAFLVLNIFKLIFSIKLKSRNLLHKDS